MKYTLNQSKVFVAIPNLGKIRTGLTNWIIACQGKFNSDKIPFNVIFYLPVNRPIEVNRNNIVKEFLKSDCTHLLFVDSDIMPSMDLIPRFLNHNKDVIGGYVPIWHPILKKPTFFSFKKKDGDYEFVDPKLGFQECDFVGTGIMMIKREVIENIEKPLFKQVFDELLTKVVKGEDQYFCELAKKNGFKIWVDCTRIESQEKNIDLVQTLNIKKESKLTQPTKQTDISKFKNKLFIGRQHKTPDGKTLDVIGNPDVKCDISQGIPLDDNKFDYIEIHHLLEHFESETFIKIIQDIHRISTDGGIIDIKVPYKEQMYEDPTHKTGFSEGTFERFTPEFWKDYGNECWYNDKWFHIVNRQISKTELHIILKTDKKIEVVQ